MSDPPLTRRRLLRYGTPAIAALGGCTSPARSGQSTQTGGGDDTTVGTDQTTATQDLSELEFSGEPLATGLRSPVGVTATSAGRSNVRPTTSWTGSRTSSRSGWKSSGGRRDVVVSIWTVMTGLGGLAGIALALMAAEHNFSAMSQFWEWLRGDLYVSETELEEKLEGLATTEDLEAIEERLDRIEDELEDEDFFEGW